MKLILIHENIESDELLIQSFNSDCIIRKMSEYPTFDNLITSIDLSGITHLAFVYKFWGVINIPLLDSSKKSKYEYFNQDIVTLLNLLKEQNQDLIVDIITCNLNNESFIESVNNIQSELGINIRYSVDQTGNNPEGNWVLESDNVNIKNDYFKDSIDFWDSKLDYTYSNDTESYTVQSGYGFQSPIIEFDTSGSITSVEFLTAVSYWSGNVIKAYFNIKRAGQPNFVGIQDGTWLIDNTNTTLQQWRKVLLPEIINVNPGDQFYFSHTSLDTGRIYQCSLIEGSTVYRFTVENTSTTITTPLSITNCSLWLDANDVPGVNGASLTSWSDKTSYSRNAIGYNNHNGTGTLPTKISSGLNSKNIINLTGNNDYFKVAGYSFNTTESTYFILAKITSIPSTPDQRYGLVSTDEAGNYGRGIGFWGTNSNSSFTNKYFVIYPYDFANTTVDISLNQWVILTASYNSTNNYAIFTSNGTIQTPNIGVNAQTSIGSDGLKIGIMNTAYASNTSCQIAEVIVYDGLLSNKNRQNVEGYLANKWGLTSSLSTNHPFAISLLNAPTNLVKQSGAPGQITLSWTPPSGSISYYNIYKSTNQFTGYTVDSSSNTTTKTITGLTNGTIYYFKVTAVNSSGESSQSTVWASRILAIPGAPTDISSSEITQTSLKLNWQIPTNFFPGDISSYKIYKSTDNNNFTVDSSSNVTMKTITGLTSNTTYYFKVSITSIDGYESTLSSAFTQATLNIVPNVPTSLNASSVTSTSLTLSWTTPVANGGSSITYYNIYKSTDNSIFTIDSSSNTTSKAITGLLVNTTYYFKVSAVNSQGEGSQSSELQETTLNIIPDIPTSLFASDISSTSLTLSWTEPEANGGSAITYYNIYKLTNDNTYTVDSSSNTTSKAITGLSVFTTYYFKVSAVNNQGEGTYSDTLTQKTASTVPNQVANLSGVPISYSQIDVSWNIPTFDGGSEVSGYNLHISKIVGMGFGGGPPFALIPYIDISNVQTTYYNLTDLSSNTQYGITVEAFNINGKSEPNNIVVTTLPPLPKPTDLSMNDGILYWNGPVEATSYKIKLFDGTTFNEIETGYLDEYYDTKPLSLSLGLNKIRVISVNDQNTSIDISGEYQFTTSKPDAPTNVQVIENTLSWDYSPDTISSNVTNYKISYWDNLTSTYVLALTIGNTNNQSLSSEWVPPGTTKFRVQAVNTYGNSSELDGIVILSTVWGVPATPVFVTTIPDNEQILVQWNNVESMYTPLTYTLFLYDGDNNEINYVENINTNSYNYTSLTNGITYKFKVKSVNPSGESSLSSFISNIPYTAADQISSVGIVAGNTIIDLSWNAPFNGGRDISDYLIEKSENETDWIADGSSNTTYYTAAGLTNGNTYNFRVTAINLAGSNEPSLTVSEIPYTTADQISQVSITAGNTTIDLSWNAPFNGGRDISDYLIEKSENNLDWVMDGYSNTTFYTSIELSNDITYYYRVSVRNLAGTNEPSDSVSETPYDNPYQIHPVQIIAGNTIIDLSWNAPADGGRDISDYLIEKSLNNSDWISDGSSNTTYYTADGLTNGQRYYFRVYARNIDGLSPASNTISEIPYTYSNPVRNFNSIKYASSVELSWEIPLDNGGADISGYMLTYYPIEGLSTIISNITNTSYNVSGLEPNTEYTFEIVVKNKAGNSNLESITLTTYATTAPVNFSGDASDNSVYLSWEPPLDNGGLDISGYVISINTEGYSDISLNADILNYNYTGLINGTTYQFTIYAFNEVGIGQTTFISKKTTEYTPTSELPPGQDYYVITIDGIDTQYENTLVVTDFSQNDIGISQDPTLFNTPTLFITSTFDISSLDNLITTAITGYQKQISSILIKRDVSGEEITSQGKIQSVLEGNTIAYDLSENYTELKFDESDLSDNVLSVLSVIESTLSEIENKRYMKFFVKLIDLSSEELITNGFNLPILFNLTKTNVTAESLILKRLNEITIEYETIDTVFDISSQVFTFDLISNSEYILEQVVPDPPIDLSAYQIGSGSTSQVFVNFVPPTFIGASAIISYTLEASANAETTKTITITDLSDSILVPFLKIGKLWTFKVKATNSDGSSIWSENVTLTPTGSGTTTGDPIITTIYDEKYLLPNVNGRFLIFDNKKPDYSLYITADCFFLTPKELMNSVFISKWATDYTFMKTLNVKYKNNEFSIDMNTLNVILKTKNNKEIIIGNIYEDKMVLSRHYSANRKKELGENLKFNGKSRKIEIKHNNKVYTLRVSVDLGCADHRNEFVLDGPDMVSGYGAIISKNHKSKLMDLKL
jgi:hypothetical protein